MIATNKRVVLITLFVTLALLLAACGGAPATEAPSGGEEAVQPTESPKEEPEAPKEEPKEEPTEAPEAESEATAAEPAGEVVELRMTWYTDGNEDVAMRALLDQFEAENPNIKVVMDNVAYTTIRENLPIQLAAGEGPDIARVTSLGGLSEFYLDMSPYLSDTGYWEESFGPFLNWLRPPGDEKGIYGFMTQLTVTGPFINRTLFEQAGIEVPSDTSDNVTWEEWADVTRQVAEATDTDFALAMDRTGHRFAGPAISQGAKYFDAEGNPVIDDEGFRKMSQLLLDWHADGTMPMEVWAGATGYAPANEMFINGQVVMYMSGSWQIGQFAEKIGDAFDWSVVPNPCGPAACSGMPGGAALVAIKDTKHPAEVAKVMEFLASKDALEQFSAQSLFIPGHLGLAESGVNYETDSEQASKSLSVFVEQVGKLDPTAFALQAYPFNGSIFDATRDRLTQAIVGEMTLDEAIQRIQEDVDQALAEAGQ
jgi:alpha-1,4-digalacturonate transport system substrate-binding protein